MGNMWQTREQEEATCCPVVYIGIITVPLSILSPNLAKGGDGVLIFVPINLATHILVEVWSESIPQLRMRFSVTLL